MSDIDDILGGGTIEVLSAEAFGEMVGVSGRTVRELAQKGIITKDGGQYPVRSGLLAYCAHLRGQAAGRGGSATLTQERIRVAREQADALAMKNAVARGEMVPARDVEASWIAVLREVRSAMLALPSRIQLRLGHLTATDVSEIDREVRQALEEASNEHS